MKINIGFIPAFIASIIITMFTHIKKDMDIFGNGFNWIMALISLIWLIAIVYPLFRKVSK